MILLSIKGTIHCGHSVFLLDYVLSKQSDTAMSFGVARRMEDGLTSRSYSDSVTLAAQGIYCWSLATTHS
jgi:hypothetical protein